MSEDIRAKSFLPPDDYEILRFGGESVKDEEKGIERISKEKDFMYKMASENRSWKEKRQGF